MRVLHAETGEANFRITIGNVVAIAVGIEKQIWRLKHEHAAVAESESAGEIQTGDEIVCAVGAAIAIGVLKDGDAVGAFRTARWRFRNAVVDGARPAIHLGALETRGIGILKVLNDPQPPAVVEL